jgi:solute carrier family 10 (sodium/bile acid cotransporter), member 7
MSCFGFILWRFLYFVFFYQLHPLTCTIFPILIVAAKGNAAVALMLTVSTNILAIFTVPFTVKLVIDVENVTINAADLLVKLAVTILAPLIAGKILRELFAPIRRFVAAHKVGLGLLNNGSLIFIVWQTLSSSQSSVINTAFKNLALMALAAVLLHIAYLLVNGALMVGFMRVPDSFKAVRVEVTEAVAVLIMASEKTLPMAVTVIAFLPEEAGSTGQLTVPCVIAHISQVLIDAWLAHRIANKVRPAFSFRIKA